MVVRDIRRQALIGIPLSIIKIGSLFFKAGK